MALSAGMLQGCQTLDKVNILAAIDGPFVPRSERGANVQEQSLAAAAASEEETIIAAPAPEEEATDVATAFADFRAPARTESTPAPPPVTAPRPEPATRELPALAASVLEMAPARRPASQPALTLPSPLTGFRSFYEFTLASLAKPGDRESMLLADPPSLNPALKSCERLPPAVLIDLDPAGGLIPLTSSSAPDPEFATSLATLRRRGATIYWISGHLPDAEPQLRELLKESGMDPGGIDPLIATGLGAERKQERRHALGESHCLIAILGDNRGDFDELFDYLRDPALAEPLEVHIGQGWFIAPPPLD
ncbi:hypothetical protein [Alteraurantiacibacter aquimixticola]|nr:hypothetical protein [Alteraurantiacibacter aquimixticola]